MDGLKKAYYRTYQQVFDLGMRCLHWRKPIVISGAGSIRQVPDVLSKCGVTKVMVVTGSHVVKSLGPKLFAALEDAGMPYEVFSEVEANPSVNTVEKIRAQYVETGCGGFVALGGGSPMDATKGAAARVACPKKSCDDMAGVMRVGKTVPPIVAIPTTSGTGSETTIAAVITDSETHHKYALMDLKLMPLYAILDPELTVGLPPRTTATTGMDALTHAIEAYISWTYNTKESLRLAEEAVKLIFDNLELAYQHGEDLKVRENMMIAAFKAGFAFSRAASAMCTPSRTRSAACTTRRTAWPMQSSCRSSLRTTARPYIRNLRACARSPESRPTARTPRRLGPSSRRSMP